MFLGLLPTSLRRRKCNNYPTRDDLFKLPVIRCTTHAESQHIVTLFAHASFRSEAPLKVTSLLSLCDRSLRGSTQRNFPNSVTFKSDAIDQFANSRSCGLRLMAVVLLPFRKTRRHGDSIRNERPTKTLKRVRTRETSLFWEAAGFKRETWVKVSLLIFIQ